MQLSPKETAALLNISERTLARWINRHSIPAQQLHERTGFNRLELLEWAQSVGANPPRPGAGESPSRALERGGLITRLEAHSPAEVFDRLSAAIELPGEADRILLREVLSARLKLGPNPAAGGLLLPQARKPLIVPLNEPCLTIAYLEQPVDFGAGDGQPVHTVMLLTSPAVRRHLDLLARLTLALKDRQLRELLKERAPLPELLTALSLTETL